MQFHGVGDSLTSLTLYKAIMQNKISDSYAWLGINIQHKCRLCHTFMHDDVKILHNDNYNAKQYSTYQLEN